jgi:hypothetical protein
VNRANRHAYTSLTCNNSKVVSSSSRALRPYEVASWLAHFSRYRDIPINLLERLLPLKSQSKISSIFFGPFSLGRGTIAQTVARSRLGGAPRRWLLAPEA